MYSVQYADRSFYSQRNNPVDVYNQLKGEVDYLESCMASAVVNACVSVLGKEPTYKIITDLQMDGTYKIVNNTMQPEQLAWELLNDKNNWPDLQKYRILSEETMMNENIVPSRVPQYIPYITDKLFNLLSTFRWISPSDIFTRCVNSVMSNIPTVLQFIDPGHYIAVLKYDEDKDILLYNDSAYGKDQELTREQVIKNIECYTVEITPPKEC